MYLPAAESVHCGKPNSVRQTWLFASSNRSAFNNGTIAMDHGHECFSKSINAPSRRACAMTGATGGAPGSNGVLCPMTRNAPSVWDLPALRTISYSVLSG